MIKLHTTHVSLWRNVCTRTPRVLVRVITERAKDPRFIVYRCHFTVPWPPAGLDPFSALHPLPTSHQLAPFSRNAHCRLHDISAHALIENDDDFLGLGNVTASHCLVPYLNFLSNYSTLQEKASQQPCGEVPFPSIGGSNQLELP